jgi:membrane protein implicated in regulation of membrane protease activity
VLTLHNPEETTMGNNLDLIAMAFCAVCILAAPAAMLQLGPDSLVTQGVTVATISSAAILLYALVSGRRA